MQNPPLSRWIVPVKPLSVAITLALLQSGFAPTAIGNQGDMPMLANTRRAVQSNAILPARPTEYQQSLWLDVFFDEQPRNLLAHFYLRDERLLIAPEELHRIGLLDMGVPVTDGLIALDQLLGLSYRYEVANQRVYLHVPISMLPVQQLGYQIPQAVQAQRGRGVLLSYDNYLQGSRKNAVTLSNVSSLRWFGAYGAIEQRILLNALGANAGIQRLDTFWTYSDAQRMWAWRVGDLVSSGLPWTRPVRIAGLQWQRNFTTRPDLITLPIPRFTSSSAVPTSVELYVDAIRQYSGQANSGTFALDVFPRISGAGEATIVQTDVLGRTTQITVPLYIDHQRMAKGFSDFSVEMGYLRSGFGGNQDSYGKDLVTSASWRYGMSDWLTVESHGELGPGLQLGGLGAVWSPFNRWGLVSAAYALSVGDKRGQQISWGYQWNTKTYGFDLQRQRQNDGYRDLGNLDQSIISTLPFSHLRAQDRATAWSSLPRGSLTYTWLQSREQSGLIHRSHSLSWTQTLGQRLSLSGSAFKDYQAGLGVNLSLNIVGPGNIDTGASFDHHDAKTVSNVSLRQTPNFEGGWGWSASASDRDGGQAQLVASQRAINHELAFGVQHQREHDSASVQMNGSLVWMNGDVFAARRVSDAFALVSTGGKAGIPVLKENRVVGYSNKKGYLLLNELNGWQKNRIAIDPDDLPANISIGALEQRVIPADRTGIMVNFELRQESSALITLLDDKDNFLPAGATVSLLNGQRSDLLVGFDGQVYVQDLKPGAVIEWEVSPLLHCRYQLPTPVSNSGRIAQIGPLACLEAR
jgi:outer membrane usher protein